MSDRGRKLDDLLRFLDSASPEERSLLGRRRKKGAERRLGKQGINGEVGPSLVENVKFLKTLRQRREREATRKR